MLSNKWDSREAGDYCCCTAGGSTSIATAFCVPISLAPQKDGRCTSLLKSNSEKWGLSSAHRKKPIKQLQISNLKMCHRNQAALHRTKVDHVINTISPIHGISIRVVNKESVLQSISQRGQWPKRFNGNVGESFTESTPNQPQCSSNWRLTQAAWWLKPSPLCSSLIPSGSWFWTSPIKRGWVRIPGWGNGMNGWMTGWASGSGKSF